MKDIHSERLDQMLRHHMIFAAFSTMFAVSLVSPALAAPKNSVNLSTQKAVSTQLVTNYTPDDGPWCGTGTGHKPIPKPKNIGIQNPGYRVQLNPQPLPPGLQSTTSIQR